MMILPNILFGMNISRKRLIKKRLPYSVTLLCFFLYILYLGDGQNLADTLRLEYDGWYFATHGKQMRFLRHKTRERNEDSSEVILPITPEIQKF